MERVAIIPSVVQTLTKKGFTVNVEEGAGKEAKFTNDQYVSAGAKLVDRINAYQSGEYSYFFKQSNNKYKVVINIYFYRYHIKGETACH